MSIHTCWKSSRVFFFFILLSIAVAPRAHAQMSGDQAALDKAATAIRANLDRLKTWKGSAKIVTRSFRTDEDRRTRREYSARFLVDVARDEYWYFVTSDSVTNEKTAAAIDYPLISEGGMSHNRLFLKVRFAPHQIARLEYRPKEIRAWQPLAFQPKCFYTFQGQYQDLYLKRLDWNFHQDAASGSVTKADNDCVVVTHEDDSGFLQTRTYSLAHGGNLTSFESIEPSEQEQREYLHTWEWEDRNGVFVPTKITESRKVIEPRQGQPDIESETIITFIEQEVNAPLPPDAFGLKHLKLQAGDEIRDGRFNKAFTITAPEAERGLRIGQ